MATVTFTITCQVITVTNPANNSGTAGVAFSEQFTQSGGVGTVTWSETGALPAGITLNTSTGLLSGTPTQTGSFPITVKATDSGGCSGVGPTYTLVIGCQAITVTNPSANTGTAGAALTPAGNYTFTQTGGVGTITWSKTGALPTGVTLDSSTGILSGTTNQTGSFPITVTATDANGCFGTSSYTLTINCQTITVTNAATNTGTAGTAFSSGSFSATGILGTATWSETGALPTGITQNTSTGALSGTTSQTGSFPITVTATDTNGCFGTSSYTLTINCQTITVTNAATNSGTAGVNFSSGSFSASGILGTATWSESGALPTGITQNTSTGALSGTPTQTGSFPITVKATDTNLCFGTSSYTLTIVCPTITVTRNGGGAFPNAIYNTAYAGQSFTASGSNGTPYTFTKTAGTFPTNLTLASNGTISGTPTVTGVYNFTVTATDVFGCTGTLVTSITVVPNLVAETYSDVGNTQLAGGVAAPATPSVGVVGVGSNDTSDTTITYALSSGPSQGAVTVNSNGTFLYTPAAGNNTTATFVYSGTSNGATATQTATINFSNKVWYVNSSGANGDGRSNTPFNSMTGADTASIANDYVFVHTGAATTTGTITLAAGQTLWGQGTTFILGPLTITATTKPTLTGTVTLGGNNDTVSSLDISSVGSTGITNSGTIKGGVGGKRDNDDHHERYRLYFF